MSLHYAVVCGGVSSEREVSLVSGREVHASLSKDRDVDLVVLDEKALPAQITQDTIVVSMLHGVYGEDGGFQELLERAGIEYVGSDAKASELTFDKVETKQIVKMAGVRVVHEVVFDANRGVPITAGVCNQLGEDLVLKPVAEGSSVGVRLTTTESELEAALAEIRMGRWMIETRIRGREYSVGVLAGKAQGIVEIRPKGGVYDYKHKYTKGLVDYFFPAEVEESVAAEMKSFAEIAFASTGCRDYARVDFMCDERGRVFFLEVNTIPGMTPTSLLPKSASCEGYDFDSLVRQMLAPAELRFRARYPLRNG